MELQEYDGIPSCVGAAVLHGGHAVSEIAGIGFIVHPLVTLTQKLFTRALFQKYLHAATYNDYRKEEAVDPNDLAAAIC